MDELLNVKVKDLDEISKYFEKEIEKITGEKLNIYTKPLLDLETISFVRVDDYNYSVPHNTSGYKTIVRVSGLWEPDDRFKTFKEAIDYFFDENTAKTISQIQYNLLVRDNNTGVDCATSLENSEAINKVFISLGARVVNSTSRDTISIVFDGIEYYIVKCNNSIYFMVNDITEDSSIKKSFIDFGFKDFIDKDFDEIEN